MKSLNVVTFGDSASGMFVEIWGLNENNEDACLSREPLVDDDNHVIELDTADKRAVLTQV